ncbi:MAG: response regulator [Lachnospiraceae bacterium]
MLKVLIADDENKVCQLVEKLVDWNALGMEIVAVAENGIEALEKIKEFHPDIAITDIRMPGYDGLDLIRMGKEENPKMEFVIISGYRHFEYAQMAIRYGVNAYLLKPIKKDELMETLGKLGSRFREQTERLSREEKARLALESDEKSLRQTFLLDVVNRRKKERLFDPLRVINEEFRYGLRQGEFCIAIIKLDGHVCDDEKNRGFMIEKVQAASQRLLSEYMIDWEMAPEGGFLFFLLNFETGQRNAVRRQMKALLEETKVQGGILKDLAVTASLGRSCTALAGIDDSLRNARLLIEERLIAGTGKLMDGELPGGESFVDSEMFAKFNNRISQTLEGLDVFAVREELLQLKSHMMENRGITGHEILQMTKEICNQYLFFMKKYRIPVEEDFMESYRASADNCADAAELFDYLIRHVTVSYEKAARLKRQDENRPIRLVKKYVSEHYAEPLTLELVSGVAGLSAAYLSTVFKKDTGMTFLEYLSTVRMDMAKQLLKETNFTVADICVKVGYSDVRYFTKSFTKYAGLKPNEYRKLYS